MKYRKPEGRQLREVGSGSSYHLTWEEVQLIVTKWDSVDDERFGVLAKSLLENGVDIPLPQFDEQEADLIMTGEVDDERFSVLLRDILKKSRA